MSLLAPCMTALALAAVVVTQSVRMTLTDKTTGKPVVGAEVSVVGHSGMVRTDADGTFTLNPEPKPPFVLLIALPGGRIAKPVRVETLTESMTINVEAAVSEELTVSGVAPSIDATPAAGLTMVTLRDVQLRAPANLMQALENVPGVNQVSEGQAAVPAVRGMARGRTLILIDGSRVTSERRVGPSATFLDPSVVDGIDIARGPGSVAYGSDAFGGVISVRTRRPAHTGVQGAASLTLGEGIPDRRVDGSFSKGFGSGGVLVSAHFRDTDDYRGPDTDVLNSGWGDAGFLVRAEQRAGAGLFSLSWQSDLGDDIERPRNDSNEVRFYYPWENSHRFNASYERDDTAGLDRVRVSGFLGTIDQRTDQDRVPSATRPRDIVRADIDAKDLQFRITGEKLVDWGNLEFGADVNGRFGLEAHDIIVLYDLDGNVVSESDTLSIESARRTDTGLFAQMESPLGARVSVKGGVRGDFVSNVNQGGFFGDRSVSNSAASGFVALSATPVTNFTVSGQVARGFRDPTLSDRFFRGPTGRGFITGNPDLKPETSLQWDISARYVTPRMRIAGYVYRYDIEELIERYQTEPDFFFFRNRGRARVRGVEFEAQAETGRGIAVEFAAQISRGRAVDDDSDLDDVSPDNLSVLIRKSFNDKVMAFARLAICAEDDRPGPTEIVAPGHTNLDLGASWTMSRRLELRGALRNVLNDEYYASPDPRFVLAPGINGFVTLAVKY